MILLLSCTFVSDSEWKARVDAECADATGWLDEDGDGWGSQALAGCAAVDGVEQGGDCDDADAAVHPGAEELAHDGVDQDCDGDAGDDVDGDGVPWPTDCWDSPDDPLPTTEDSCEPTTSPELEPADVNPGAVDSPYDGVDADCAGDSDFDADGDDWVSCEECDDGDEGSHPGATETWYDGVDQDCDGRDDDQDGDGYLSADDCDDEDAAVHPGATEIHHDDVDQNCVPEDEDDVDGDGWDEGPDCDDADPAVNPSAEESWYDGVDQDCDGNDDDQDEDGYGLGEGDCADTDAAVRPNATETWYDGVDQDCDGNDDDQDEDGSPVDLDCDDTDAARAPEADELWYNGVDEDCDGRDDDQDGDGYLLAEDCDDTRADVHPDAVEAWYDGSDQDCDGNDDDQDGDSWALGVDCDDLDPAVHPDALEDCGTTADDDCDGASDAEGALACLDFWLDADLDGFGGAASACWCSADAGRSDLGGDCDDADAAISPAATESCATAADDDCDGAADAEDALACTVFYADADGDGLAGTEAACRCEAGDLSASAEDCDDADPGVGLAPDWFVDADGDGFGDDGSFVSACTLPDGASAVGGDCNDADAAVAALTSAWADVDLDGWGDPSVAVSVCYVEAGSSLLPLDCDDSLASVRPDAEEDCATSYDDDCDGDTNNEDAVGSVCWYRDDDGDGVGAGECRAFCTASSLWVASTDDDCDPDDATVYPDAPETCGDGLDADCDPTACDLRGAGSVADADLVLRGQSAERSGSALAAVADHLAVAGSGYGGGLGAVWLWTGGWTGEHSLAEAPLQVVGAVPWNGVGQVVAFADRAGALLLVGGERVDAWYADGGTALLFGTDTTGVLDPTNAKREIIPAAAGDALGGAFAAAPGLDGGSSDVFAVGAHGYAGAGAVSVLGVDGSGPSAFEEGTVLKATTAGSRLGRALHAADLDGDGLSDLVAGGPGAATGNGRAWTFLGPIDVERTDAEAEVVVEGVGGDFGAVLGSLDHDGDGLRSLVVSAASESSVGAVHVFDGETRVAVLRGELSGDNAGRALATTDLDADGHDDLVLGSAASSLLGAGIVSVFYGEGLGDLVLGDADASWEGDATGDLVGNALACLEDADGDGFPELVAGGPNEDGAGAEAGATWLWAGSGD